MAGGTFGGGVGTASNPYLVQDAQDLNAMRTKGMSLHYKQTANINLLPTYTNWTPFNALVGSYDGGHFTIDNLTITSVPTGVNAALFGMLNDLNATIKNVKLTNVNINVPSIYQVGSLVAQLQRGTIMQCSASGTVIGGSETGGLVGQASNSSGYSYIKNSYSTCSVSGSNNVGGLIGYAGQYMDIQNSYAIGNVDGQTYVGGFCGFTTSFNSTNKTKMINCYSRGDVRGIGVLGGFVGDAAYFPEITNCYALCDFVTRLSGTNAFIGQFYGNMPTTTYVTGIRTLSTMTFVI